jgi:programmed cell death 8 (apoptosis-inducing factor)
VEQKKEAYAKAGAVHPEGMCTYAMYVCRAGAAGGQHGGKNAVRVRPSLHLPSAVAEEQLTPQVSSPPTSVATPEPPPEPVAPPIPLPDKVPYVLVGGGTASFAAAKAIREREPTAKVLIVTEERHPPYSRPPLSKHLWASTDHEAARQLKFTAPWSGGKLVDVFYNAEFCSPGELMDREDGGIALLTGTKVVALDTKNCAISLDGGHVITYDKCLLATGGQPKTLPLFDNAPDTVKKHVSVYRQVRGGGVMWCSDGEWQCVEEVVCV